MSTDSFETIKSSIQNRYQEQDKQINMQNIQADINNMTSLNFNSDDNLMNVIGLEVQRR